jgi:hypothetical protein
VANTKATQGLVASRNFERRGHHGDLTAGWGGHGRYLYVGISTPILCPHLSLHSRPE